MSKVLVDGTDLSSIASAIRQKTGGSTLYKPSEMAQAVRDIPTGITPTGTKNITQNGTHDVTQYASAAVNVPNSYSAADEGKVVSNGALAAQGSQTITRNGTYDTTLIRELIANISGGGGSTSILDGTSEPSSADGVDGDIYIKYADFESGVWSNGYTPLEYIQSSGTQFITTDYVPNLDTVAKISLSSQYIQESGIFGSSWTYDGFLLIFYGNRVRWHSNPSHDVNTRNIATDELLDIRVDKGSITLNGVTYSISEATYYANNVLSFFAATTGTTSGHLGRYKLFASEIYENDVIVKNFVPAKRDSDDALGICDTVSGTFYPNSGTGVFTAGSELSGKPIKNVYLKVSGTWQELIGSDIDDVSTGN